MFTREYLDRATNSLSLAYRSHHDRRGDIEEGVHLVATHLINMQNQIPMPAPLHDENPTRFYHTETGFAQILESLELTPPPNLLAMYGMLFPPNPETPRYTRDQLTRVAYATLGLVQREALDSAPTVQPALPPVSVAEAAFGVLSHHASSKLAEVANIAPGNTGELLEALRSANDALDMRDDLPVRVDTGFLLPVEDIQFNNDMERALAMSVKASGTTKTEIQSDYEFAKTLALSQAQADDEIDQYERDMARAMALSQAATVQHYMLDDLFDEDPELSRVLKRKLGD